MPNLESRVGEFLTHVKACLKLAAEDALTPPTCCELFLDN